MYWLKSWILTLKGQIIKLMDSLNFKSYNELNISIFLAIFIFSAKSGARRFLSLMHTYVPVIWVWEWTEIWESWKGKYQNSDPCKNREFLNIRYISCDNNKLSGMHVSVRKNIQMQNGLKQTNWWGSNLDIFFKFEACVCAHDACAGIVLSLHVEPCLKFMCTKPG